MKKILLIAIASVLMTTTSVMAQFSTDTLLGVNFGYGVPWYTQEKGNTKFRQSQPMLSAGLFFDMTIIRINVDYCRSFGDYQTKGNNTDLNIDYTNYTDKYSKSSLDLSAIGKFPFDLGLVKIWGGAGVLYSINLTEKYDGDDVSDNRKLDDFYLIAAAGADVTLNEMVFLCPALTIGYNLTPNPWSHDVSGVDYYGYMWKASVGVGMKI
jgi:hypothetical protein